MTVRASLDRELVAALGALSGDLGRRFAAVAATESITAAQWNLLRQLDAPSPMGRVARLLHCDPSNVTGLTRRLVDRGLVEVLPDAGSARVRLLGRTGDGAAAAARLESRLFDGFAPSSALSVAETRSLVDLLDRIRPMFADQDAEP